MERALAAFSFLPLRDQLLLFYPTRMYMLAYLRRQNLNNDQIACEG